MKLSSAKRKDIPLIMELISQGKEHLRQQGVSQWQNGYPSVSDIEKDISSEKAYLIVEQKLVIGYLCIDFDGDPVYPTLKGKWLSNEKYGVIHRMTIGDSFRGKGRAGDVLKLAEKICQSRGVSSIRIDTDSTNQKMQHILDKSGFIPCGSLWIDGSEKIGYEKLLFEKIGALR